jgi:hypothetical protein
MMRFATNREHLTHSLCYKVLFLQCPRAINLSIMLYLSTGLRSQLAYSPMLRQLLIVRTCLLKLTPEELNFSSLDSKILPTVTGFHFLSTCYNEGTL